MPSGTIGEAFVAILPDTSGFEAALRTGTSGGLANLSKGFLAVGAAAAGGIGVSIDMATKFQTSLLDIEARMKLTAAQGKAIGDAFLSTAGKATFSANTIAAAFAPVAGQLDTINKHALSSGQSLAFMNTSMALAEASGTDLATTTSTLAGVMQAYSLSLSQAGTVSDILFNASNALGIGVDTLGSTVDRLHAKLGPLAPSLADVGSLLLDVASHGLTGSRALLLVSTGFNTLLGNSKSTNAEIKALNLHVFTANGQFVGMQSIIGQLAPKLAGMTEQQRLLAEKELFGSGASKALDATLLAGLPAYDKSAKAATATGTALQAATTKTSGLGGDWDRLKSSVGDLATEVGTVLIPKLTDFVTWITHNEKPIAILTGALASFYVVHKGISVFKALESDLGSLLGKASSLFNGGASAATTAVGDVAGLRVFVTNWAMIGGVGGKGVPGVPGVLGGAAGADAITAATGSGASVAVTIAGLATLFAGLAYADFKVLTDPSQRPASAGGQGRTNPSNGGTNALSQPGFGSRPGEPIDLGWLNQANLDINQAAKAIRVSASGAKTEWNDLLLLARGGKRDWNEFFTSIGGDLKNTLQAGSNTAIATNDLYQLFKAGKVKNATQLQTWEDDWNKIQLATGENSGFAQGIATNMELAGKLTDKQVPAFILAFNTLVKEGMNPAAITAVEVANQMALALATAANLNQSIATINAAAALFYSTNRLTLPHGRAPTGPGAGKGHPPPGVPPGGSHGTPPIAQTNHFYGTQNIAEVNAAIQQNNTQLIRLIRAGAR